MTFKELEQEKIVYIAEYVRALKILFQELRKIKDEVRDLLKLNNKDEIAEQKLLILLRNLTNDVYSSCEIINEMFIIIYRNDERYRGCVLANGFSANFKRVFAYNVKKEKPKSTIYTDKLLVKFYSQAEKWYVKLHDIRTQETHYYIGTIYFRENEEYYKNENRNGISKTLYTNPDKVIDIPIYSILSYVDDFLNTETEICKIVCQNAKA